MEIQNSNHQWNVGGKLIDFQVPKIMGIINATPDSFFKGSRAGGTDEALRKAESQLLAGADFLDIGGYSSRPGADDISEEEELKRLIPVVEKISNAFPEAVISADTFRSKVAQQAVNAGAHIINDICFGEGDPRMFETVAQLGTPYIGMHKQGTPKTMQLNPSYDDVVSEILEYGKHSLDQLRALGISQLAFDPGFGFGKSSSHNFTLLREFQSFQELQVPLLAGISRKGMIWKNLNITPDEALNGTSILHAWLLERGANILRVHDVKEAVEVRELFLLLNK